jgi:tetratricopeptide (TPR) repeat protein
MPKRVPRLSAPSSLLVLLTAAAGGSAPRAAAAQQEFVTQKIIVHTLSGERPGMGRRAADAIAKGLERGTPRRELSVMNRVELVRELERAGYSGDSALTLGPVQTAARQFRADEYVTGSVAGTGDRVRITGAIVLARDTRLVQPITTPVLPGVNVAADSFAAEAIRARQQMIPLRRCENFLRSGERERAAAAALQGVRAYPRATLARACLLRASAALGAAPDSILSIAMALLAVDSVSPAAWEAAARAYDAKGDREHGGRAWAAVAAAQPNDVEVIATVTAALMSEGNGAIARPIIERAFAEHPDNEHLAGLRWLVLLQAEEWAKATEAGETLRKAYPAYESRPDYFLKMALAYRQAGDPVRAVAAAADGVARHPRDAELYLLYTQLVQGEGPVVLGRGLERFPANGKLLALDAQVRRRSGDARGALEATRRALAADTTLARGYLQLAQAYLDVAQPDSALAVLAGSLRGAADSAAVGQFALARANELYRSANGTKRRPDFEMALRFAQLADRVTPSPVAGFLVGASAFGVAQLATPDAVAAKSCETITLAGEMLALAEAKLMPNQAIAAEAVTQMMQYARQLGPYVAQEQKLFCKPAASAGGGPAPDHRRS